MVNSALAPLPAAEEELNFTTVPISEVILKEMRLEAEVYGIEGKHAREVVDRCPWPKAALTGEGGIATVQYPSRFKRIFLEHSSLPIFQPSQITDLKPRLTLFISELTPANLEELRVKNGQILLTRSGTVGTSAFVGESYNGQIFSDDLLRIDALEDDDAGYIYTFLRSKTGHTLVNTNNYGAVVKHIEPHQLTALQVPYPDISIRKKINSLIRESYKKRDAANELIDKATDLLKVNLSLPEMRTITAKSPQADTHSVKASHLNGRFEAGYHHTKIDRLLAHLANHAKEIKRIGDSDLSKDIILPGRFKRVYVNEGQGVVFFGGKQIFELDPSNKKSLS